MTGSFLAFFSWQAVSCWLLKIGFPSQGTAPNRRVYDAPSFRANLTLWLGAQRLEGKRKTTWFRGYPFCLLSSHGSKPVTRLENTHTHTPHVTTPNSWRVALDKMLHQYHLCQWKGQTPEHALRARAHHPAPRGTC